MFERKHLVGTFVSLGLLATFAATAGGDSIRFVSRVPAGIASATGEDASRTYGPSYPFQGAPPPGSLVSADGRYTVFSSDADNLIAGLADTNGAAEIYLRDRLAGTTVLVSRSDAGPTIAANGESREPAISADGRFVVFSSRGTDLVAGQNDANGDFDVFVFDRVTGTNTLVSRAAGASATAGDAGSGGGSISAEGGWIAFLSGADDLVTGQAASTSTQVFLFDRTAGTAVLVSHAAATPTVPGNGASWDGSLSADGSFLAYASTATDLVTGHTDSNGGGDVFLYDRSTGLSRLVSRSHSSATRAGSHASSGPVLSADGSHVAFVSLAGDLVADQSGPPLASTNVFLYRRADAAMALVSHALAGVQQEGNADSYSPALSQDASHVAFTSVAANLVESPGPLPDSPQVFLFRRSDGAVSPVSQRAAQGSGTWAAAGHPRISADGGRVAFASHVHRTFQEDPDIQRHIYLYSRASGTRTLVSRAAASASAPGNGESTGPELSADGQAVVFASFASDLVERDFNERQDVFVYSPATGGLGALSLAAVPAQGSAWNSLSPALSADGNVVVFVSRSRNLVPGQVDTNEEDDVFVWSRTAGTTSLVSRAAGTAATAAQGGSRFPALSADGGWIAFETSASDVVPGQDGTASNQLVLVERATGAATLVTTVPGFLSAAPVLSRDGRFVSFMGSYSGLVPGVSGQHAFLYDRAADRTVLVSHASGAPALGANAAVAEIDLSADGRFVAFTSAATDLVAGQSDTNGVPDLFLYDRETGEVALVSRKAGTPAATGSGRSLDPAISADGRWILFRSLASDLMPGQGDAGATQDLFLYDRIAGTLALVTHAAGQPATAAGTGTLLAPHYDLSADGRFVVFMSSAGNLTGDVFPNPGAPQVFLYDRTTGESVLVSHAAGVPGVAGNDSAGAFSSISADGRFVAFSSLATNHVAGVVEDGSSLSDVFLYERATGDLELVSRSDASPLVARGGAPRGLSADGSQILLESGGALAAEDGNGNLTDIYLYENLLPAQDFYSVVLCRALDTRQPADGPALASGVRELFTVSGACGVPVAAKAVVLNVTVAQATGAGYLKLHAGNASSSASAINFAAGQVRSNNTVVRLSTDGDGTLAITPFVAGGGTVHVILDVMGYFE